MPSNLVRGIFSRRADAEETIGRQATGQASEEPKIRALQDSPPPYTSENRVLDSGKVKASPDRSDTAQMSTQPASEMSPIDTIQLCPHATSSFERIQRIMRLPNFKECYHGIDALTFGPNHRGFYTVGTRLCKPDSGSSASISGWGKYQYDRYGTLCSRKDRETVMTGEGLVLLFHWKINFSSIKRRQSREDVYHLLAQAKIDVCTHLQLSDPMIVTAVYKHLHAGDDETDPIDLWEAGCINGTTIVGCEECDFRRDKRR